MSYERVKYYPSTDLCFAHNLDKIETMNIPAFSDIKINDAIEFSEIHKYFEKGIKSTDWSEDEYNTYIEKSNTLRKLTFRYFNTLCDNNIIENIEAVDIIYRERFWELFDSCKLYNKISEEKFSEIINSEKIAPYDIFIHKDIVYKYGNTLRAYILSHTSCIRIILQLYYQKLENMQNVYVPKEFTGEDIAVYVENYIDSENPNMNVLDEIIKVRYSDSFPVTDEIRLKAKRKYEAKGKELLNKNNVLTFGISVEISDNQKEEKIVENKNGTSKLSYSKNWLMETLDYPSILNNFIYIFEYVDFPQMRFNHVSKKYQAGVFEITMRNDSPRIYPDYLTFNHINMIGNIQMEAYYNFLKNNNIRLEDVLTYFFTEYLQKEFGCAEIRVNFPSEGTTFLEKCNNIVPAFDAILRQIKMFIEKGSIDFDLINMSTSPILFPNIPSRLSNKYIYGTGEVFKRLSFYLFSDQCILSYIDRIQSKGRQYNTLLELLTHETVYLSDYSEIDSLAFNFLEKYGLINIKSDRSIALDNLKKITILRDLYCNDVISRYHYPPEFQEIINNWIDEGLLIQNSSLFSDPEVKYLNYMLNRSNYDNGLELRNTYSHGIQQVNSDDNIHKDNYFILLRLFVLLAIKINDDFELKELTQTNEAKTNATAN